MLRVTGAATTIPMEDIQLLAKRATGPEVLKKTLTLHAVWHNNYTVALLMNGKRVVEEGKVPFWMGVSKRNPIDRYDPSIGLKIAIRRCFDHYNANPPA